MHTYLFYIKNLDTPPEDILNEVISVKDSFSITGFIFGLFWLLYHKLWKQSAIVFLLMIIINIISNYGVNNTSFSLFITVAISLYIGFNGYDMLQHKLYKSGYKFCSVIVADNQELASIKFLNSYISNTNQNIN